MAINGANTGRLFFSPDDLSPPLSYLYKICHLPLPELTLPLSLANMP
jgi:hypothetical protein